MSESPRTKYVKVGRIGRNPFFGSKHNLDGPTLQTRLSPTMHGSSKKLALSQTRGNYLQPGTNVTLRHFQIVRIFFFFNFLRMNCKILFVQEWPNNQICTFLHLNQLTFQLNNSPTTTLNCVKLVNSESRITNLVNGTRTHKTEF